MRITLAAIVMILGCAGSERPPATPTRSPPPASAACADPAFRQFDFWIGDWDVVVRARAAPDKEEWGEARGTQHIESILGGCVISENFAADGPQEPWAGKSYSTWQVKTQQWRQTWVDSQGSYLAFTGGLENGVMTLYGEPLARDGKRVQMRMIFLDVSRDAMRWEWQRSVEGGPWTAMMRIAYRRRR